MEKRRNVLEELGYFDLNQRLISSSEFLWFFFVFLDKKNIIALFFMNSHE